MHVTGVRKVHILTCISALTLQVAGWWDQMADAAVSIGDGVDRSLVILFIAHLYNLKRF